MTKTQQKSGTHNADHRSVIAGQIVDRSTIANDMLGSTMLSNLMSPAPVCTNGISDGHKSAGHKSAGQSGPEQSDSGQSAESLAKQRETSVDDLLADPMMSDLWQAYAITESDVRQLVSEMTNRLKSHGELHRRIEALTARCA